MEKTSLRAWCKNEHQEKLVNHVLNFLESEKTILTFVPTKCGFVLTFFKEELDTIIRMFDELLKKFGSFDGFELWSGNSEICFERKLSAC